MIINDRQLAVARRKLADLRSSRQQMTDEVSRISYDHLINDLKKEISDFLEVSSGNVRSFGLSSLDDLGKSLIKARIAKGITQRALAEELGVTEQMVQKDEARLYETAGVARIADILDALGYEVVGQVRVKSSTTPPLRKELQNKTVTTDIEPKNVEKVYEDSRFLAQKPGNYAKSAHNRKTLGDGRGLVGDLFIAHIDYDQK